VETRSARLVALRRPVRSRFARTARFAADGFLGGFGRGYDVVDLAPAALQLADAVEHLEADALALG